jgi:hypothetical protein
VHSNPFAAADTKYQPVGRFRRISSQKNQVKQNFDPFSKYEGPVSDFIGTKERIFGVLNEVGS